MLNRTKEYIKKLGVRQRDLANELGMTPVGLQQIMNTPLPKISTLEPIAKALGVPTWQLYLTDDEIAEIVEAHRATETSTASCPCCGRTLHIEIS